MAQGSSEDMPKSVVAAHDDGMLQLSSESVLQPSSSCLVAESSPEDVDIPQVVELMNDAAGSSTNGSGTAVADITAVGVAASSESGPANTTMVQVAAAMEVVPTKSVAFDEVTKHPWHTRHTAAKLDNLLSAFATGPTSADQNTSTHPLAASPPPNPQSPSKVRMFDQMVRPGDDERTAISKQISWILRHGAKKVNVEIDDEGWVPLAQLLNADILGGISEERLMAVIVESTMQKELSSDREQTHIHAIAKSHKSQAARERRKRNTDDSWQHSRHTEEKERPGIDCTDHRIYDRPLQGQCFPVEGKGGFVPRPDMHTSSQKATPFGQLRWRVVQSKVIVRLGEEVNSEPVTTLERGSLVVQLGEEKQLDNGLVRVMIETMEPQSSIRGLVNESKELQSGVRGWVTRTAAPAGDPVFFEQDRVWRDDAAGARGRWKGASVVNKGRGRGIFGDKGIGV